MTLDPKEGRALVAEATLGEWSVHDGTSVFTVYGEDGALDLAEVWRRDDANLTCWLRNHAEELLSAAEQLAEARAELAEERGRLSKAWAILTGEHWMHTRTPDSVLDAAREVVAKLTEARAEVDRLRAELATANHWRDRHAKDSEAYAAQSQTNWTRAESAEREREEMRVALQFYAEGKCRCGVEYQAGERARAALKGGK